MDIASSVIVCALSLLGRSPQQFPPITLLAAAPAGLSIGTEGFVHRNPDTIYLITSTEVFRTAIAAQARGRCAGRQALQKIASIIVHEEWHLTQGGGEQAAYEAQLTALAVMGAGPGSAVHASVRRSMRAVLDAARRREQQQQQQPPVILTPPPQIASLGPDR